MTLTLDLLPTAHGIQATVSSPASRCHNCPVRTSALCESLNDEDLATLSGLGRRRNMKAGQVLTWAGDAANLVANIVSGALKVTALTVDGREQIVALLFPGDFVGQLFSDRNALTVTAIVDTDLCTYTRPAFEALLDEFPTLQRTLLKQVLASLNDAQDRMLTLGRKTAHERVAGFLQFLAKRIGCEGPDGAIDICLPVTRCEMADYLGLTIETVSRQLTRLRTASVLTFIGGSRDCRILDPEQLDYLVNPI